MNDLSTTFTANSRSHPLRPIELSDGDFKQICQLIYQEAGIILNASKKEMVYGRLMKRLKTLNIHQFGTYLTLLNAPEGLPEREHFVNALTTNLTFFFREEHHFPILAQHLQQKAALGQTHFTIWCAAASTGEEAYSIAVTAQEALASFTKKKFTLRILATDIDTASLEVGKYGIYSPDKMVYLPKPYLKYFIPLSEKAFQISPTIRQFITFEKLNLTHNTWRLATRFDSIFCRNVMIYFNRNTQLDILKRFSSLLQPDGLLFVGHSENVYFAEDFVSKGKNVYGYLGSSSLLSCSK